MKGHEDRLTQREVDTLCGLYMDCALDTLEEAELEYALRRGGYDSETARETLAVMEASRSSAPTAAKHRKAPGRKARLWLALTGTAACVAALIAAGSMLSSPSETEYTAYINGQRLTGDDARELVESRMERSKQFEAQMARLIEETDHKIKRLKSNTL